MWGITESVLTACLRLCCPPLLRLTLLPNTALHKRFGNTTGGRSPASTVLKVNVWLIHVKSNRTIFPSLLVFIYEEKLFIRRQTTIPRFTLSTWPRDSREAWLLGGRGRQGAWDREMRSHSAAFFQGRMPVELSGSISINSMSFKWRIVFNYCYKNKTFFLIC